MNGVFEIKSKPQTGRR